MSLAATAPPIRTGATWSTRAQGALALGALLAAVLVTVALVAAPASGGAGGASGAGAGAATSGTGATLPAGLRVEVRGGEPFLAYRVADRLTGAGAALGAVQPAASRDAAAETTTIVYYDRASMAAAGRIRSMLGRGTLRRQQVFQPVVDVTIVLGKDLSRL